MVYEYNIIFAIIIIIASTLCFYNKVDFFTFYIVLESIHLFIAVMLLHEVWIYNSRGLLVAILYILCLGVLKSVIGITLCILMQNKNNSFFL